VNYLAHSLLSCESPAAITGAMLGDFVKGGELQRWPAPVQQAVVRHRDIDIFTDGHARFRQSRARISDARRLFSGVLVDVFYDHFLARHWSRFCHQPLATFTRRVYDVLWPQRAAFPARLQRVLPYMVADDWLASYAEIDAVEAALDGIAWRLRRYARARVLHGAITELLDQYRELEKDFLDFFPALTAYVDERRRAA
jgi:acyl carrier protein phosphodiesterase